ncbi:hypothetical protein M0R45_006832 [Rubus argutus]|uniref:Uncharacterized protein n=1 Tax=Rubus argutus TaxID=59490 RepID=A0AAW1YRQ5_RUBAR
MQCRFERRARIEGGVGQTTTVEVRTRGNEQDIVGFWTERPDRCLLNFTVTEMELAGRTGRRTTATWLGSLWIDDAARRDRCEETEGARDGCSCARWRRAVKRWCLIVAEELIDVI